MFLLTLRACITLSVCIVVSEGHGRLLEPPSRASAWRQGYDAPINYNDNQMFCGGFSIQWQQNAGQCGICGDNFAGPHDYEAPDGKYFVPQIYRNYEIGSSIKVAVYLTANHKGYVEFRLCQNDDPDGKVTQKCFDEHLLYIEAAGGTRWPVKSTYHNMTTKVRLPAGVKCDACIIQWKYNTGNSWGVDPDGTGCVGCGPQEQFYGCADVGIGSTRAITRPMKDKSAVVVPDGDINENEKWDDDKSPDGGNHDHDDKCVCSNTQSSASAIQNRVDKLVLLLSMAAMVAFL